MGLARMIKEDKTALICDLAETYQIYDMYSYKARFIATLACGLKADSRIKTKMAGVTISPPNSLLYALIVDELRAIRYWLMGGKEKPMFISDIMENGLPEKDNMGFNSGAEFEEYRKKILSKVK